MSVRGLFAIEKWKEGGKPTLSISQIINMNFGFFGIQYSFGLQQTAINPIYTFLDANPEQLPILNLAGPMTGLLIQPIIGAMSDKTWSNRWGGRRKPYFLIGAITCSIALLFMPFSSTLWMAAGLLWILDAGNNTAMEPYRAFIADRLPKEQFATGFLIQSFFTGLGITVANLSLFFFQKYISGTSDNDIPYWVFGAFLVGAFCSVASVLWSLYTTPEIEPQPHELEYINPHKGGIMQPLIEIRDAIVSMPKPLWQLALVYLFQWYAMFCYWQYVSHSIAKSVWNTSASENIDLYSEAAGWTGLVNGFYNIITFISAFFLIRMTQKRSAKSIHALCLMLAAFALLTMPLIHDKYLLFLPMIGFGIAWASMMGIPYIIVAHEIPSEKNGVYMGIVNMMIVIPMIIQTLSFGYIYKNALDSDPGTALQFAGILLLLASIATMNIKVTKAG
jgi:maltose/moltooligosaccharide transporter